MRSLQASLIVCALLAAAAPTQITPTYAQSAYDYPWCAVYTGRNGGGAMSCYYASRELCMQTMSGIGGQCIRSPYYNEGPRTERFRRGDYRRY